MHDVPPDCSSSFRSPFHLPECLSDSVLDRGRYFQLFQPPNSKFLPDRRYDRLIVVQVRQSEVIALTTRQEERIAIRILEIDVWERSSFRRAQKLHASREKLLIGVLHIITPK